MTSTYSKRFSAFVTMALGLSVTSVVYAQSENSQAPFRAGQVAVYAAPSDISDYTVERFYPRSGISVLSVSPGREFGEVQRLRERGFNASVNRIATKSDNPNDPIYSYQWHFENVQASQAWDLSTGSTGSTSVVVAVLDTGLATDGAKDGVVRCATGKDVAYNDDDPDDGDGHGTHVSGTIAQVTNNGTGVAGLAYDACVLPVKVLNDSGSGSFADIAEGIHYAVDEKAQVINMSLGTNARAGLTNDAIMDPALDYAYENGVTVVAAAGNDGHRKNVSYPAIYPSVIAVGATGYNNAVVRYSNKGKGLDLVAPGGDLSADRNGDDYGDGVLQETRIDGTWGYYFFQGTSMASPHVAAIAALLISNANAVTPDAVSEALENTALDLGESGYDKNSGHGLVQAYDALTYSFGGGGGGGDDPEGCIDLDGDGFCDEVHGGDDCDDSDADVHPGHQDSRGKWGRNDVDNDCNGVVDG